MWEYKREVAQFEDYQVKEIVEVMNKFGADGWEIVSILEKVGSHKRYGEAITTYYYTFFMKRPCNGIGIV